MSDLTLKAAELARTAPHQWSEFLAALAERVEEKKDELIRSPIEVVTTMQGRAQEAASLFALLRDAVKNADRLSDLRERRGKTFSSKELF